MTQRDDEFRSWVTSQRATLLRTAVLLTAGDVHTAEDVVQTTLTRLYLAWPRVREIDQRDAYARRSLVNAFTDEVRRSWRGHEHSRADLPERAAPDRADADERSQALYDALRELPPRMRATVVLRYLHEMSTADTARLLRCTQGTVKSQTARALTKLASSLGPLLDSNSSDPLTRPRPQPRLDTAAPHLGGIS